MRRFAIALLSMLVSATAVAVPSALAEPPSSATAGPVAVEGQLLVGYREGTPASERAEARSESSARLLERVVAGRAGRREVELVQLPSGANRDAALRRFENHPHVAYAEPNWIVTTAVTSDDPAYENGSLWGMYGDATSPANQYGSQAGEAWAAGGTGSPTVAVGIIDTGVDVNHPDLAANVWTNPHEIAGNGTDDDGNGYVDDIHGWDFHNGNATVYDAGDGDEHGTHVAGTIAGVGGNGMGVAGVAWSADLITTKFLGPRGGTTANAVKAVDYLTDLKTRHGVDVVASNNSWGGGGYSTALHDAIERANTASILFVAAAGNGGSDKVGDDNDATPQYPSSYPNTNVIAVASITSSGARSGFSNYGLKSVDLGAPGSNITSTTPGGTYSTYSGTSMATPHVTGGVVLAAAAGSGRGSVIRDAIFATVVPTTSMKDKTVTGGRLDVSGIVPVGSTPVTAVTDSYAATEDTALTVSGAAGVLSNDDPDGATAELASRPSHAASFSLAPDGSFAYTPATDFNGGDSFTYRAILDGVASAPATVTITVAAVNDAPVAVDDALQATAGTTLTVAAPGVLANDSDPDGTSGLSAVLVSGPSTGTLTLDASGSLSFAADAGDARTDSFRYEVVDAGGLVSVAATVTIDIAAARTSSTYVTDLDGSAVNRGGSWTPSVTIRTSPATSGATVSGRWASGSTLSCTTDTTGACSVTGPTLKKNVSSITFTVTGITSGSLIYDATLNDDPDGDSNGTSITISKP